MPWLNAWLEPAGLGAITGLALGLTGGGGTMLAVPLLIHGLGLDPHAAAAVALVAVGVMALIGAVARWRAHQLQPHLGLIFAGAGMLGAPLGALIARQLPAMALTVGFSLLSLAVAVRLWRRAHGAMPTDSQPLPPQALLSGAACRFDPHGRLRLTSQCLLLLALAGLGTGVISGVFGVGGGFVVVPALVLISGIDIRQAVATSLLVVALVSGSGAAAVFAAGQRVDPGLVALFAGGGVAGLEFGSRLGRHLPAQLVQRLFAVALVAVASAMILIPLMSSGGAP